MLRRLSISFFVVLILATLAASANAVLAPKKNATNDNPELSAIAAELRARESSSRGLDPNAAKRKALGAPDDKLPTRDPELRKLTTNQLIDKFRSQFRSIYGQDNRQDIFDVTDLTVKAKADSVVAITDIEHIKLTDDNTKVELPGLKTMREEMQLCATERFSDQPSGCWCSGFLVAPDIVATAGHCYDSGPIDDVKKMVFIFGFEMENNTTARTKFDVSQVYNGESLIGFERNEDTGSDWALIKLSRPVVGHEPLKISKTPVEKGTSLYVIGYPTGLPKKFSPNGSVMNNDQSAYFETNLDTFGGNSGSPVFNAKTNEIEGILVRGREDYYAATEEGCMKAYSYPDDIDGEAVTRISQILPTFDQALASGN